MRAFKRTYALALEADFFPVLHFLAPGIHFLGEGGAKSPRDLSTHVMGEILARGGTHMTRGTDRGIHVIEPYYPSFPVRIQLTLENLTRNSLFRFFVDLNVKVIGIEMTRFAIFRFPGLLF
jgi:hypothetical protein